MKPVNPVRARQRRRLWLALTSITALLAAIYSTIVNAVADHPLLPWHTLEGLGYGTLIGGAWAAYHIFLEQGALLAGMRRLSFTANVALSTAASLAIVIVGYRVCGLVFTPVAQRFFGLEGSGHPLLSDATAQDLAFGLTLVFFTQFALRVRRIIGARVLGNFLRGRYHRPLREERIFLFLDLADSTRLAHRLGDETAQEMITRFFFDVDQVTTAHGGETHRYIGDEVVVTWPLAADSRDGACLACLAAVRRDVAARAADYQARFGTVPRFRAALHGGPVVAAECGDSKQEIVYFGETINIAARIAGQCKALDRPWLISRQLLERLDLPPGLAAESIATVRLAGHDHDTDLVAITEIGTDS